MPASIYCSIAHSAATCHQNQGGIRKIDPSSRPNKNHLDQTKIILTKTNITFPFKNQQKQTKIISTKQKLPQQTPESPETSAAAVGKIGTNKGNVVPSWLLSGRGIMFSTLAQQTCFNMLGQQSSIRHQYCYKSHPRSLKQYHSTHTLHLGT